MNNKYYIYLSCSEKIKVNPADIGDYLDSIKDSIPKSMHRRVDDIRNRKEIDLDVLLNTLHNMSGEKRVEIECILKADDITSARENLSLANVQNCIYVANLDEKDTDKIGYWELGHADAKNITIIGYRTGRFGSCVKDLESSVGLEISRDVYHFMKKVSYILERLGYSIPNNHYLANRTKSWNNGRNVFNSCSDIQK